MNTVEIKNGSFEGFRLRHVKEYIEYSSGVTLKRKGKELCIRNNILTAYHPSNRHIPIREYNVEDVLNEVNLHLLLEKMS